MYWKKAYKYNMEYIYERHDNVAVKEKEDEEE